MKRKEFLKWATPAFLLLANGNIARAGEQMDALMKKKKRVRFAIASDIHYGQPGTDYDNYIKKAVARINEEHAGNPFDFCMLNGDIVHNDPVHYPAVKDRIGQLKMKYYVTPGNHDMVTPEHWERIWNRPVNYDFTVNGTAFLAGTTSNEKGEYICPDLKWMEERLEAHKRAKNIFVIVHINPAKLTTHGIDCPEFLALLKRYKNVRAVFNGHDHDEDGIKKKGEIPFVFDAHVGGDWGTAYRGFRVVELLEDETVLTYVLNPDSKINNATL
ncbi:metallophosphoesterase family protein [Niabella beijingensis]|uniref:metallophosphoesterase family protein n=1 Tax=Niabella beijingensis TaxID=2872700 RepID=UPI001CC15BB0|nr:metallophosphoesterase [Niabella beijingensis]MBZ4190840.1 metallophosphoesterase [Niabella beijingensis]